ncbi:Cytosine permease [Pantoea agglomerans]|uniref:Cytosine permease n=1 Tax=Enterobacter agglomerans TaxID=549 RepID=A0A379AE58_ENTAG|nr:Cytosine permease [Pantoea agglomerans]
MKTSTTPALEQEFEHEPVPLSHRHSTRSVSAVWFGFPMILTNALFGGIITWHLGFWPALIAILLGNLVLFAYVGALSWYAGNSGMNFALQARRTFGSKGYILVSGFLSTVVIGWYAFQTGLTGTVINQTFGWNALAVTAFAMILYTGITFLGVRALSVLGMIAAPLFVVLGMVALWLISKQHDFSVVTQWKGSASAAGAMSMGTAVTMVVAGFADSGTMTADFTRWSKNGRSAGDRRVLCLPRRQRHLLSVRVWVIVAVGAAVDPLTNGGNFLPMLMGHSAFLSVVACLFVFINLGSVCTHCLYNGAGGLQSSVQQQNAALDADPGCHWRRACAGGCLVLLPGVAQPAWHCGATVWCRDDRGFNFYGAHQRAASGAAFSWYCVCRLGDWQPVCGDRPRRFPSIR